MLTRLPADAPPIVIVQHMPAGFTKAFAARLDGVCRMRVVEAADGEPLERGVAYVAPGGHHLTVERQGLRLLTRLDQQPPIHYQRPAVDALFDVGGAPARPADRGVLLTGMGADGADGMVALRNAGAETIAEAEESCVVFGMPKEAIARGGAAHVSSLLAIPDLVFDCLTPPEPRQPRELIRHGARPPTRDRPSATGRGARLVVGIGELAVSQTPDDVIVTHALGSCIAVCVWDPAARVARTAPLPAARGEAEHGPRPQAAGHLRRQRHRAALPDRLRARRRQEALRRAPRRRRRGGRPSGHRPRSTSASATS